MKRILPASAATTPRFWRDDALPFIEAREIADGRAVCYARHSHEVFSVGVISGGYSRYLNGTAQQQVCAGSVVLMNPGDVHACNPIHDSMWSYRMLYIDTRWLHDLQCEQGFNPNPDFQPFSTIASSHPALFAGFNHFYDVLTAPQNALLAKQTAAVTFGVQMQQLLNPAPWQEREVNSKLERAAEFIHAHCSENLSLAQICEAADLSASYLIRAFKRYYAMTPHAFLLDCRIQLARRLLRQDEALSEVALAAGFADQAHFQRVFKQLSAATPGQYRAAKMF